MRPAVPVYCLCTPAEVRPFFQEAGLVHDQDTAVGAGVFGGVGAQVVADGIGVPAGIAQQALHRSGPGVAGLFGQLPAVLPLNARQQPEQMGASRLPRLNPPEPARDPGHDPVESPTSG